MKKEEAEKCTDENASACYDHTGNMGIGPVKVMSIYRTADCWAGTLANHSCACCSHELIQHRDCMLAQQELNPDAVNMLYQDLTGSFFVQVAEKFPSKADAAYPYSEVLHKSFLFYYQQRSGKLPHQVCPHAYITHLPALLGQPRHICELHQTSTGLCYPV